MLFCSLTNCITIVLVWRVKENANAIIKNEDKLTVINTAKEAGNPAAARKKNGDEMKARELRKEEAPLGLHFFISLPLFNFYKGTIIIF